MIQAESDSSAVALSFVWLRIPDWHRFLYGFQNAFGVSGDTLNGVRTPHDLQNSRNLTPDFVIARHDAADDCDFEPVITAVQLSR